MQHIDALDALTAPYGALHMEALMVRAHMAGQQPIVVVDPIALDALLAYAVVQDATQGRGVPNAADGYWIPVPLQLVWQDAAGFPLWAAGAMHPAVEAVDDVVYTHKRSPVGNMSRGTVSGSVGRWMERRRPLPTVICAAWEAHCIGHAETIRQLLVTHVTALGRMRNAGGAVAHWEILPAGGVDTAAILVQDGRLTHALPVAAAVALALHPSSPAQSVGWTPPLWNPALKTLGYPVGTAVAPAPEIDYFAALDAIIQPN